MAAGQKLERRFADFFEERLQGFIPGELLGEIKQDLEGNVGLDHGNLLLFVVRKGPAEHRRLSGPSW